MIKNFFINYKNLIKACLALTFVLFITSCMSTGEGKSSPKLKVRKEFEGKFAARYGKDYAKVIIKYDLFGLSKKKCMISDLYLDAFNEKVPLPVYKRKLHIAYQKYTLLTEAHIEDNIFKKLNIMAKRYNQFAPTLNLSPVKYEPKLKSSPKMLAVAVKVNKKFNSIPIVHPVKKFQITSKFGKRFHPLKKTARFHKGIDIVSHAGHMPIYSSNDGRVVFAGKMNGYGNIVKVYHGNNVFSLYAHLDNIYVRKGMAVNAGQVIGEMGSTGGATGKHLHYELQVNNKVIDPSTFVRLNNCSG